jgi:hypothetical protein
MCGVYTRFWPTLFFCGRAWKKGAAEFGEREKQKEERWSRCEVCKPKAQAYLKFQASLCEWTCVAFLMARGA